MRTPEYYYTYHGLDAPLQWFADNLTAVELSRQHTCLKNVCYGLTNPVDQAIVQAYTMDRNRTFPCFRPNRDTDLILLTDIPWSIFKSSGQGKSDMDNIWHWNANLKVKTATSQKMLEIYQYMALTSYFADTAFPHQYYSVYTHYTAHIKKLLISVLRVAVVKCGSNSTKKHWLI